MVLHSSSSVSFSKILDWTLNTEAFLWRACTIVELLARISCGEVMQRQLDLLQGPE